MDLQKHNTSFCSEEVLDGFQKKIKIWKVLNG